MPDMFSNSHLGEGSANSVAMGLDAADPGENGGSLPRRAVSRLDWITLPLIALCTIVMLVAGTELIVREKRLHSISTVQKCMLPSAAGLHAVPNSVCILTNSDGQRVEYRFNSCGDRTPLACDKKPEGVYRIVLLGSSVAMGWDVSEPDTLAERLSADLSQSTQRRVEVYNSAMFGPGDLTGRVSRDIALQPDLILWVLASHDVDKRKMKDREREFQESPRGRRGLKEFLNMPRVAGFLRGLLYRSESAYMAAYLRNIRESAQLPENSKSEEDGRMLLFNAYVRTIVEEAKAAGAPVVATAVPNRAESDLFAMSPRPAGISPDRLNDELHAIMVSNGATYIDVVPDLEKTPNLDGLYDQLGYHLNGNGHAVLTKILARALGCGAVPALSNGEQAQSEKMQKK